MNIVQNYKAIRYFLRITINDIHIIPKIIFSVIYGYVIEVPHTLRRYDVVNLRYKFNS